MHASFSRYNDVHLGRGITTHFVNCVIFYRRHTSHDMFSRGTRIIKNVSDVTTIERNADVLLNLCKDIVTLRKLSTLKCTPFTNVCKDIGIAVNTGKTKYMEIGRHRGMRAKEHIRIDSSTYKKSENF